MSVPYHERYTVNRRLPEQGRPRAEVIAELAEMASEEDAAWESGKCSGTMYCGDHDHYAFLTEAFGLFAHVNVLQRDICPSATKMEGEIIAMALDLLNAESGSVGSVPVDSHGFHQSVVLTLPPLGALFLVPDEEE